MPDVQRKASGGEIAQMAELLSESVDAGAIGASIGTYYPPARAADADEIVGVCASLDPGLHRLAVHLRDEGDSVMDALKEADEIARRLKIPLVISHHKVAGTRNYGRSSQTLAFIQQIASERSVCMGCYPYDASSTMLMPQFAAAAKRVIVAWSDQRPEFAGMDLDDIASQLQCTREDAARRLEPGGATYFSMSEDDVRAILVHPLTMIASDGLPHDRNPHPRLWGTFPRVLGRLARDLGWLTFEVAVKKMTSMPAERFGLAGRGRIQKGCSADIVLLRRDEILDVADYSQPLQPPKGIEKVFVNGQLKVDRGRIAAMAGGAVLRSKR